MDSQTRKRWMQKIDQLILNANFQYASFLCRELLYFEPNYVNAREKLHHIREQVKIESKWRQWLKSSGKLCQIAYFMLRIKTKHCQLLECLDDLLDIDPHNEWFLRIFAEIMSGFGFFESSIFLVKCIPENRRNEDDWLLIGESYLGSEDFELAMEMANKVLSQSPDNIRARDLLWKSSVEQSIGNDQ